MFYIIFWNPKSYFYLDAIIAAVIITSLLVLFGNMLAPEKRGLLFGLRNFQITHVLSILKAIDQRILLFGGFNLCVASQIKVIEATYYYALFVSFNKTTLFLWMFISIILRTAFCSFG